MKTAQHDALAAFDFTLVEMCFGERVLNCAVVQHCHHAAHALGVVNFG